MSSVVVDSTNAIEMQAKARPPAIIVLPSGEARACRSTDRSLAPAGSRLALPAA